MTRAYNRQASTLGKKQRNETVIIKTGKIGYAETLKKLKNNINLEETQVKIIGLNKTQAGDLRIRIEKKKEGGAADLEKLVREKMTGVDVKIKQNTETFYVLDVELDVTNEEAEL